jgi:hypothetical protein
MRTFHLVILAWALSLLVVSAWANYVPSAGPCQ